MIEADRIISWQAKVDEDVIDRAIRPKLLADYVGQPASARADGYFHQGNQTTSRCLRSFIDFWPSWLGKTTLANIVAK